MSEWTAAHPDLEQYFDASGGVLPEEVRAHAQSCEQCGRDLHALAELRRRARALPREIAPRADLWPGIAARLGELPAGGARARTSAPSRAESRGAPRPTWWLAAAAVVAVLIAGGTLLSRLSPAGGGSSPASVASNEGGEPQPERGGTAPGLVAFAAAEPEYRSTVELLEAELAARRDQLDPATVEVVERNLAIVDSAIAEARRALAADPSSVDLPLLLSGVYRQKLELLQQAVRASARS